MATYYQRSKEPVGRKVVRKRIRRARAFTLNACLSAVLLFAFTTMTVWFITYMMCYACEIAIYLQRGVW